MPSGFMTSVMTRNPFVLCGSGQMNTGLSSRSDDPPCACSVDDPSNDQTGQSSSLPEKLV